MNTTDYPTLHLELKKKKVKEQLFLLLFYISVTVGSSIMSITPKYESEIVTSLQFSGTLQGRIQDFKLGGALKKIAPSGGRRENIWGGFAPALYFSR